MAVLKRINWKAVWLPLWVGFLVADQFLDLRAKLVALVTSTETASPDLFHRRLETALLALLVLIAASPFLWPLARRIFLKPPPDVSTADHAAPAASDPKPEKPQTGADPVPASPPDRPRWRDPRDMTVQEVLTYLVNETAWAAGREGQADTALTEAAIDAFEFAARKGRLSVRAERPQGVGYETLAPDYWHGAGLDVPATIDPQGVGGRTAPRRVADADKIPSHDGLVVDRAAVERVWPRDSGLRKASRATVRGLAWSVGLRRTRRSGTGRKPEEDG